MTETFSVLNPTRPTDAGQAADWPALDGLGLALALASLARRQGGPVLVVASDGYAARQLRDDLKQLDAPPVELFPD
jgi:transcription-repair coupling factor (superfamily II helicase)